MRFKLKAKIVLSKYKIFKYVYRLFSPIHKNLVKPTTDIVIEGFPRSGNTFALASFTYSNKVEVASHVHLPYQIVFAHTYTIPIIILIRHPLDAVASLMIRDSKYTVDEALVYYMMFHAVVEKYKDSLIISDFNDTVTDFPSIIQKLNNKFETSFKYHDNKEKTIDLIKQNLEKEERKKYGEGYKKVFGLPSQERASEKLVLTNSIQQSRYYNGAKKIYQDLLSQLY